MLGFSVHEIAVILLGEQGALLLLGIPAGFALGTLYAWVWMQMLNGESYRIPLVFDGGAMLVAAAVIAGMAAVAGVAVRRRLAGLDLVGVLKSRE